MADRRNLPKPGEPPLGPPRVGRVPSRHAPRPDRSRVSPSSSGGTEGGQEHGKSPSPTTSTRHLERQRRNSGREPTPQDISEMETRTAERRLRAVAHAADGGAFTREPPFGVRDAPRVIAGITAGLQAMKFVNEEDLLTRPEKYRRLKTGTEGQPVRVTTNFVAITSTWDAFVVLFDVKFAPDEPVRRFRMEFVEKMLKESGIIAPAFVYNGRNMVYLRAAAAATMGKGMSKAFAREGVPQGVTCTITFARTVGKDDAEINQFLNNMKNHWLQNILKLSMLGRAHYDPTAVIKIQEGNTRIHLWPGFETSIADYDGGKLFNVDNRFKVIRDVTMAQVLQDAFSQASRMRAPVNEARHAAAEAVVGSIVITQYSDKPRTYRITGVEWEQTADSYKFEKDGKEVSLKDYYKLKYGIIIKDSRQPLLLAEESGAARFKILGQIRRTYLLPELCNPTGLTDEMRANFRLMKTMAEHTLQHPETRTLKIYDFMSKFLTHDVVEGFIDSWQLKFATDLMPVNGRLLKPAGLQQGTKKFSYQLPRADWGMDLRSGRFQLPFDNPQNILFAYPRDALRVAGDFFHELKVVGGPMGWSPRDPIRYEYDNDRNLVQELRARCKSDVTLVIVMLQAKQKGRYDEIKNLLCRELPVISQCVVRKTLENQKNLKTVCTKIAMQMGCKLGGAPWALDANRFTYKGGIMFVGVDTFHDSGSKGGGRAAVAVVGTLDTISTEYCSRVFFQSARQEIGDQLGNAVGYLMEQFKNSGKASRYPDMVIFYRDGVGAGQLKTVLDNEVEAVRRMVTGKQAETRLAFVVVTKRHNSRFMVDNGKEMDNPMPGTVIDTAVTKQNRMDFYIVAQSVRQGTVSPTYYNVIFDDTPLTVDQMQVLTYAQCCMYFNWTGPVKVPAQCQYAHKLAFLIGQSIHDVPADILNNFLYYL